MQIRCPHCQNAIDLVDVESFSDVSCESCQNHFSLASETLSTMERPSGDMMVGRFRLVRRLGMGSFGEVWQAKDTELDRSVAVKLPRKQSPSQTETEQFLREARAAAQLKHPGIVSIHEVGTKDGRVYIVSDLIQGVDLSERLEANPFRPREACELVVKVADALHHAHTQGVIHRDLKPANIMLDGDGQAHVMDFGMAKREAGEITMTVEGQILGTPAYMSPEQAKGDAHNADARSDVYALGVILFELLTGERPFRGKQRMLLHQIMHDDAPSLRRLNNRIPRDAETICLKCLEKAPDRRYQTAAELAADLTNWLEERPITARPVSSIERAWRWCQRKPALAGFWGIATALLLTIAVGGWLFAIKQSEFAAQETKNAQKQTELRRKSDDARRDALAAAEAAREQTQLAQRTLQQLIFEIPRTLDKVPGTSEVRRRVLAIAFQSLQKIAEEYAVSGLADRQVLTVYFEMGDLFLNAGAGQDVDWLHSLSTDIVKDDAHLGPTRWTPISAAQLMYERAHDVANELVAADPTDSDSQSLLALSFNKLAKVKLLLDERDAARDYYQRGHDIQVKLVESNPGPTYLGGLATSCIHLGDLAQDDKKLTEAMEFYKRAHKINTRRVNDDPNLKTRRELFLSAQRLGEISVREKQFADAFDYLRNALEFSKEIYAEEPSSRAHDDLFKSYSQLGFACVRADRHDEADSYYQLALNVAREMEKADPNNAVASSNLANALVANGSARMRSQNYKGAIEFYQQAIEIGEAFVEADPKNAAAARSLAFAYNKMSKACTSDRQLLKAATYFQKAKSLEWAKAFKQYQSSGSSAKQDEAERQAESAQGTPRVALEQRAVKSATALRRKAEGLKEGKAKAFVTAAQAYALAAETVRPFEGEMLAQEKRRYERYVGQSLACLNEAIAAGFDKFDALREDPLLRELRERPEFRSLLDSAK